MEIKTVICDLHNPVLFDAEVNELLAAGWILKKRHTLGSGQPRKGSPVHYYPVLIAELVRFPKSGGARQEEGE